MSMPLILLHGLVLFYIWNLETSTWIELRTCIFLFINVWYWNCHLGFANWFHAKYQEYMSVMEWWSTLPEEQVKKLEQELCWTISFSVHLPLILPTLRAQDAVIKLGLMVSSLPVWIVSFMVVIYTSLNMGFHLHFF